MVKTITENSSYPLPRLKPWAMQYPPRVLQTALIQDILPGDLPPSSPKSRSYIEPKEPRPQS